MDAQQLDRFTVIELAVDELGAWLDAAGDKAPMHKRELRDACWMVSQWLHHKLTREQDLEERRDRMIKIRRQLTELFPLDDTEK